MQVISSFSLVSAALLLAASAQADMCSDATKAARELSDSVTSFIQNRRDDVSADGREYVARRWANNFATADKILSQRKAKWAQAKVDYGVWLANAVRAVALWNDAAARCRGGSAYLSPTGPRKDIEKKRDYLDSKYATVVCMETLETIDVRAFLLAGLVREKGLSQPLYLQADAYEFGKLAELRAAIRKNCDKNRLPQDIYRLSMGGNYTVTREVEAEIIEPYERFVLAEVDSDVQDDHDSEFVNYLVNQALNGYASSVSLLLESGNYAMPLDARDLNGETVLMSAVVSANGDLVKWLVDFAKQHPERAGQWVNTRNRQGSTALHLCAASDNCSETSLVRLLSELNADRTLKDNYGNTPVDVARGVKRAKFVDLLLNRAVPKGAEAAGAELRRYVEKFAAEFTPKSGNIYDGVHYVTQSIAFEEGLCHPTIHKMRARDVEPYTSANSVTAITFDIKDVYDVLVYEWSPTLAMASLQMRDKESKARRLFALLGSYLQSGKLSETWDGRYMAYNDNTVESIEAPSMAHAKRIQELVKQYKAACASSN